MDIRETISKVPAWGWIAGGGLVLGLFFLVNRGNSASTMTSSGGIAPDANSILQQLQDAAGAAGGGSSGGGGSTPVTPVIPPGGGSSGGGGSTPVTPVTPSGGTTQVLSGYTAVIKNTAGVMTYSSASGRPTGTKIYNATVRTGLPRLINGHYWYQIISSSNKTLIGKYFMAGSGTSFTKIFTTTPTPTTTSTTTSVQSSNNAVA